MRILHGIRETFFLWNHESWALESGIMVKESGIRPLKIGIQNPISTDKDWNPVPLFRNLRHGIQNPRLSWIPLHGASRSNEHETVLLEGRGDE